jgi:hypothetical protein
MAGVDARKALVYPPNKWLNAIRTDVAVGAVKLSGTCDPKAIAAQTARDEFCFVV